MSALFPSEFVPSSNLPVGKYLCREERNQDSTAFFRCKAPVVYHGSSSRDEDEEEWNCNKKVREPFLLSSKRRKREEMDALHEYKYIPIIGLIQSLSCSLALTKRCHLRAAGVFHSNALGDHSNPFSSSFGEYGRRTTPTLKAACLARFFDPRVSHRIALRSPDFLRKDLERLLSNTRAQLRLSSVVESELFDLFLMKMSPSISYLRSKKDCLNTKSKDDQTDPSLDEELTTVEKLLYIILRTSVVANLPEIPDTVSPFSPHDSPLALACEKPYNEVKEPLKETVSRRGKQSEDYTFLHPIFLTLFSHPVSPQNARDGSNMQSLGVPRCLLMPGTIIAVERSLTLHRHMRWTNEIDPVVYATLSPENNTEAPRGSLGAASLLYDRPVLLGDAAKISLEDRSSTEKDSFFMLPVNTDVLDVFSRSATEDECSVRHRFSSALPLPHIVFKQCSNPLNSRVEEAINAPKMCRRQLKSKISSSLPFVMFQSTLDAQVVSAVNIALHRAMIGMLDPFGLLSIFPHEYELCRSPEKKFKSETGSIASLRVLKKVLLSNPVIREPYMKVRRSSEWVQESKENASGSEARDHDSPSRCKEAPNGSSNQVVSKWKRGVLSLLQRSCECGTLVLRLQRLCALADLPERKIALGSYGQSAADGLRQTLGILVRQTLDHSDHQLYCDPSARPMEKLVSSFSSLESVRENIFVLSQVFGVTAEADWDASKTLQNYMCTATVLSTVFQHVQNRDAVGCEGFFESEVPVASRNASAAECIRATAVEDMQDPPLIKACAGGGLQHYDALSTVLRALLSPLNRMLTVWLTKGECEDSLDEFFIIPSRGISNKGFIVCADPQRLPCFISRGTADLLLEAGVGVRLLRDALKDAGPAASFFTEQGMANGDPVNMWVSMLRTWAARSSASVSLPVLDIIPGPHTSLAAWETYFYSSYPLPPLYFHHVHSRSDSVERHPDRKLVKSSSVAGIAGLAPEEAGTVVSPVEAEALDAKKEEMKSNVSSSSSSALSCITIMMDFDEESTAKACETSIGLACQDVVEYSEDDKPLSRNSISRKNEVEEEKHALNLEVVKQQLSSPPIAGLEENESDHGINRMKLNQEQSKIPLTADVPLEAKGKKNSNGASIFYRQREEVIGRKHFYPDDEVDPQSSPLFIDELGYQHWERYLRVEKVNDDSAFEQRNGPQAAYYGSISQQLVQDCITGLRKEEADEQSQIQPTAGSYLKHCEEIMHRLLPNSEPKNSSESISLSVERSVNTAKIPLLESLQFSKEWIHDCQYLFQEGNRIRELRELEKAEPVSLLPHTMLRTATQIEPIGPYQLPSSQRAFDAFLKSLNGVRRQQQQALKYYSSYYYQVAKFTSKFLTQHTLHILLLPSIGSLRRLMTQLIDVFLFQSSTAAARLLEWWEPYSIPSFVKSTGKAAFEQMDVKKIIRELNHIMEESIEKIEPNSVYKGLWLRAKLDPSAGEALEGRSDSGTAVVGTASTSRRGPREARAAGLWGLQHEDERPSQGGEEVKEEPVATTTKGCHFLSNLMIECCGPSHLRYVLPETTQEAVGDLFSSLLLWKTIESLVTETWRFGVHSGIPRIFFFSIVSREVFLALQHHFWDGLSRSSHQFRQRWLTVDTPLLSGLPHIEAFRRETGLFFSLCRYSAFLTPQFSASHNLLRGLLRVTTNVFQLVSDCQWQLIQYRNSVVEELLKEWPVTKRSLRVVGALDKIWLSCHENMPLSRLLIPLEQLSHHLRGDSVKNRELASRKISANPHVSQKGEENEQREYQQKIQLGIENIKRERVRQLCQVEKVIEEHLNAFYRYLHELIHQLTYVMEIGDDERESPSFSTDEKSEEKYAVPNRSAAQTSCLDLLIQKLRQAEHSMSKNLFKKG